MQASRRGRHDRRDHSPRRDHDEGPCSLRRRHEVETYEGWIRALADVYYVDAPPHTEGSAHGAQNRPPKAAPIAIPEGRRSSLSRARSGVQPRAPRAARRRAQGPQPRVRRLFTIDAKKRLQGGRGGLGGRFVLEVRPAPACGDFVWPRPQSRCTSDLLRLRLTSLHSIWIRPVLGSGKTVWQRD